VANAGVVVVRSDDIDIWNAEAVFADVRRDVDALGNPDILLDLSTVTFIDSYGLGMIVRLRNDLIQRHGSLHVTGLTRLVDRVLHSTGLLELLRETP
jgi:anti-sigma B factor antagonist